MIYSIKCRTQIISAFDGRWHALSSVENSISLSLTLWPPDSAKDPRNLLETRRKSDDLSKVVKYYKIAKFEGDWMQNDEVMTFEFDQCLPLTDLGRVPKPTTSTPCKLDEITNVIKSLRLRNYRQKILFDIVLSSVRARVETCRVRASIAPHWLPIDLSSIASVAKRPLIGCWAASLIGAHFRSDFHARSDGPLRRITYPTYALRLRDHCKNLEIIHFRPKSFNVGRTACNSATKWNSKIFNKFRTVCYTRVAMDRLPTFKKYSKK